MIDPCNCDNWVTQDGYWTDGEPEVVTHCDECGCEIYDGDDYYDCDGTPRCEKCAWDWFEEMKKTAELERGDM